MHVDQYHLPSYTQDPASQTTICKCEHVCMSGSVKVAESVMRETDRHTDRHADRHTDRHTNKYTDRYTDLVAESMTSCSKLLYPHVTQVGIDLCIAGCLHGCLSMSEAGWGRCLYLLYVYLCVWMCQTGVLDPMNRLLSSGNEDIELQVSPSTYLSRPCMKFARFDTRI